MKQFHEIMARHLKPAQIKEIADYLGVWLADGSPASMARSLFEAAQRKVRLLQLFERVAEKMFEYEVPDKQRDLRPYLYQLIAARFDEAEMTALCLGVDAHAAGIELDADGLIGWDYDPYIRRTKSEALQAWMDEQGRYEELVQAVAEALSADLQVFGPPPPLPPKPEPADEAAVQTGPTRKSAPPALPAIEYDDFDIHIGKKREDDTYPMTLLKSPRGRIVNNPVPQTFDLKNPALFAPIRYLSKSRARQNHVDDLGRQLYELLFPGEIWDRFQRSRDENTADKGLRIRLQVHPEAAELSLLPWEYARRPGEIQPFALSRTTPIVRYIERDFKVRRLATSHPRLLVVLASPKHEGLAMLNEENEVAEITNALDGIPGLQWKLLQGPDTYNRLQKELLQRYDIVHFIGHGLVSGGVGALAFEDSEGGLHEVTHRQVGVLLANTGIKLMVLAACESAVHGEGDIFKGVAQSLVQADIPAVIAMQFVVEYTAARNFTQSLYDYLVAGQPLDKALTEARISANGTDQVSWGIPVLFMQSPDGVLWEPGTADKVAGGQLENVPASAGSAVPTALPVSAPADADADVAAQKATAIYQFFYGDIVQGNKEEVHGDKVGGDQIEAGGNVHKGDINISGVTGGAVSVFGDATHTEAGGDVIQDVGGDVSTGGSGTREDFTEMIQTIRQELEALKAQLDLSPGDKEDLEEDLADVEEIASQPEPNGGRLLRKLKSATEIVAATGAAAAAASGAAAAAGQLLPQLQQAAELAAKLFGG